MASGAQLVVVQFSSRDKIEVHQNDEKKILHHVVKNTPFSIELAFCGTFDHYAVDFHRFTISCVLLYDTAGAERKVSWVKSSPIDCRVKVDDGGERATAEVRIKALSSQHEDMSFRIRFTAVPPASSNLVPLSVITEPIKVLSKLSQLPKEKLHATVPRTKKRHVPAENSITASLLRIETQQRHQQALIDSLVQTMHTLQQGDQQPLHKRMRISSEDKPNHQESQGSDIQPSTLPAARGLAQAFEHSLKDLIATFPHLPTEQCAVSIRRVFGEHPANTSQLVEALLAECPTKGYGLTCGLPPNHDTASDAKGDCDFLPFDLD